MSQADCHAWLTQTIDKRLGWRGRVWLAEHYQGRVTPNKVGLDARLAGVVKPLKHDKTTTVAKLEFNGQPLVLKRYNPRSQWHKVKRALRRSRARRCWQMSYAFAEAGLNVAAPVMMFEYRFGPLRLDAYFIAQFLEGQELLTVLPSLCDQEKTLVAQEINAAFSKMEAAKLSHGDMKASNLIWSNQKLFFIDLDAAQQHRSLLSWTAAHHKDRKRFKKNWAGSAELLKLFS